MEILLRKSSSGSTRKWYHNNGQIEITGQYANGDKTDQWNWYGKNGKLLKTGRYTRGKKTVNGQSTASKRNS